MSDETLPANLVAEDRVLGGMLYAPSTIPDVMERVTADDFYRPSNGEFFNTIVDLYVDTGGIDVETVADRLDRRGLLEQSGGRKNILHLFTEAPPMGSVAKLAVLVHEYGVLRRLANAGKDITASALDRPEDVSRAVSEAQSLLFDVSEGEGGDSATQIVNVVQEGLDRLDHLLLADDDVVGIRTGYHGLDKMTSGLHPGQLIVIGARPSMGKTSFALGMAMNIAFAEQKPTMFFSLEMGKQELLERLISSDGLIPLSALKNGNLMESHWYDMWGVVQRLESANLWVDDDPTLTIQDVRARARKFQKQHGEIGCIVIDYLQLMSSVGKHDNRQHEVSEMSRGAKILAKELDTTVIALSQLSRGVETRMDKRPMLSDLRESGTIEQDADVVAFLYRDEVYVPESEFSHTAEVIVAKQRSGPTGMVRMGFLGEYTKFLNLSS